VELEIETCWIAREELSSLSLDPNGRLVICRKPDKHPKKAVVRLPGAIAELSRKLGFDVLQEPYLNDNARQVLEIGQPGALILRGARLWRSTEVTLGSQKATNIIVLPSMDGIIAQFSCVLPQLGNNGYDDEPVQTNAYVWTSEGVTTGAPVQLIWPKQNATPRRPTDPPAPADKQQNAAGPPQANAPSPPEEKQQTANTAPPPTTRTSTDARQSVDALAPTRRVAIPEKWCPDLFPKKSAAP
jgi:hypothetical protein